MQLTNRHVFSSKLLVQGYEGEVVSLQHSAARSAAPAPPAPPPVRAGQPHARHVDVVDAGPHHVVVGRRQRVLARVALPAAQSGRVPAGELFA